MELPLSLLPWIVGAAFAVFLGIWFLWYQRVRTMFGAGAFACLYRDSKGKWHRGLAMYHPDGLRWFRQNSLKFGPEFLWERESMLMVNSRPPLDEETIVNDQGLIVTVVSWRSEHLTLAMTQDSCTGFASWLEAGPPGSLSEFA